MRKAVASARCPNKEGPFWDAKKTILIKIVDFHFTCRISMEDTPDRSSPLESEKAAQDSIYTYQFQLFAQRDFPPRWVSLDGQALRASILSSPPHTHGPVLPFNTFVSLHQLKHFPPPVSMVALTFRF
jgi:hypothetical protein